jgi:heme/copper-type cytochrome/quinol oxidase subunit 2
MKYNKDLYSKEKIAEKIFNNSLIREYGQQIENRNSTIAVIAFIGGIIVVGIPLGLLLWAAYGLSKNDISNNDYKSLIISFSVLIIVGFIAFIIVIIIIGFFLDKMMGKIPTFREFSEPLLLGYELALKRFEVENKIQDYEFMFENKDFFHGLRIIKDLLNTRHMELSNELAFIPIEKRNRENEVYQMILERQLQNKQQTDWLENQLNNLSK